MPYRPLLRNTIQFNGRFGCDCCYAESVQVPKGHGTVRVYPYDALVHRRNPQLHLQEALEATSTGAVVNGVKGVSILEILSPSFDIIEGFVPDYMHSVVRCYQTVCWSLV